MNKIFLMVIIVVAYLIYARFILSPHLYKNFSLIDDGQEIEYGIYLRDCVLDRKCERLISQFMDQEAGRSRLVYWLVQGALYQSPLINAEIQHLVRVYFWGTSMVILFTLLAFSLKIRPLAIFLGLAIFVTNYSFSENMVRLGPLEHYQIIFLAVFSLLFLNQSKLYPKRKKLFYLISIIILTLFYLVRETSIILLAVVLALWIIFPKEVNHKKLILIFGFPSIIFFLAKTLFSGANIGVAYSNDYIFNLPFVIKNAREYISLLLISTSPFLKISGLLLIASFVYTKIRKQIFNYSLLYWLFCGIGFTAVFFPWKYVLDRYLLISVFCLAIFIALLFSQIINIFSELSLAKKYKRPFNIVVIVLFSFLFLRGFPINCARTINYKNWFITFTQFETDQVRSISKYEDGVIYLNATDDVNNLEVINWIPFHLSYFYNSKPEIKRIGDSIPSAGYLFSRSSLEPVINMNLLSESRYKLLESKTYSISQIDTLAFRDQFKSNPISAIKNPPLTKEGFNYYWEIRKL